MFLEKGTLFETNLQNFIIKKITNVSKFAKFKTLKCDKMLKHNI